MFSRSAMGATDDQVAIISFRVIINYLTRNCRIAGRSLAKPITASGDSKQQNETPTDRGIFVSGERK